MPQESRLGRTCVMWWGKVVTLIMSHPTWVIVVPVPSALVYLVGSGPLSLGHAFKDAFTDADGRIRSVAYSSFTFIKEILQAQNTVLFLRSL